MKRLRIITCTLDEYGNIKKRVVKNVRKRTRPRKSRDRRLLEALLKCLSVNIYSDDETGFAHGSLTKTQAKELIFIKQAMEKKGGGK